MKRLLVCFAVLLVAFTQKQEEIKSWIRINQLGYQPNGVKVAVWCSKENAGISNWELVDALSNKSVYTSKPGKASW